MPPTPAGCSITRLLSVMANCPSRKKPSRGVVATQFGLPRPAFRNALCVLFEVLLARLINSSLISNGLSASNFRNVRISAISRSWTWMARQEPHIVSKAEADHFSLGNDMILPRVRIRIGEDEEHPY